MSSITHEPARTTAFDSLRAGSALMALAGVGFIGYAVVFFVLNFSDSFLELGITRSQVDVSRDEIKAFSPDLFEYVSHLHIAVAGFIAAAGLATAALAWFGVRRGETWAYVTGVVTPVLGLAVALPAHYPYGLATIGHLGLIYLAVVIFVIGAAMALPSIWSHRAGQSTRTT